MKYRIADIFDGKGVKSAYWRLHGVVFNKPNMCYLIATLN